jgi:hypothetical protein
VGILKRLFGPPPARITPFADPALGPLVYDAQAEAWLKMIDANGQSIRLTIDGDTEPHADLRQHAAGLESSLPDLLAQLPVFLQRGALQRPTLASEISGLEVDEIAFWWDKEPDAAMVWLRGGVDGRMWHATYRRGELADLAFDD